MKALVTDLPASREKAQVVERPCHDVDMAVGKGDFETVDLTMNFPRQAIAQEPITIALNRQGGGDVIEFVDRAGLTDIAGMPNLIGFFRGESFEQLGVEVRNPVADMGVSDHNDTKVRFHDQDCFSTEAR